MKLSIIVPVYNVEKYLEECVESIFHQDLDENIFEVILVNDGSTDKSREICKKLVEDNKNVKLVNQENKGLSGARNTGIKKAIGEYLYFIDSDDYLVPGYLNRFLEICKEEDLDFLSFGNFRNSQRFNPKAKATELDLVLSGLDGITILADFNWNNSACMYLFKKDILNGLLFEIDRLCEDGIFTTQLLQKVKKGNIYRNKVYCYFENEQSIVNTVNIVRRDKLLNDMFFAAGFFDTIIKQLPKEHENYQKSLDRMKSRQQSYTFFAITRFLKSNRNFYEILPYLDELSRLQFPAYPIYNFDGYKRLKNKALICVYNKKKLLSLLVSFNKIFKIIK